MLEARNITQGYKGTTIIQDLSWNLDPGVTGLLGPNGAGKSTLMRTLATVQPHRSGVLKVAGVEVTSEKTARQARAHIGYLPQSFGFDPAMRVHEFVSYGAWIRGVNKRDRATAVSEAIEYVGLSERRNSKMGSLSGGMKQRAGIAWAIVGKPPIVILDEPTVGLDPEQRIEFRELLQGLTDVAVLLSTHITDDIDAACDRVAVMKNGDIVFNGAVDAFKDAAAGTRGNTAIERAYIHMLNSVDGKAGVNA